MSSMLLKAVLLCVLSPVVMAASVTIELDTAISIGSITYTDTDSGWINHDSAKKGLESFQEVSIFHPDVISGGLYEQDNGSLDLLIKDNYLTLKSISLNGYQGSIDYPAIENPIASYGLINGVPYLLDTEADTIWQWDADVDYWNDLKASLNLPDGEYNALYTFGGHYLLSLTDEVNNGLWEIGLTKRQLSGISLGEDSSLVATNQGLLQIFKNDQGQNESYWLNGNPSNYIMSLDPSLYPYIVTAISTSGTVFVFYGQGYSDVTWLDSTASIPEPIAFPADMTAFNGCYGSNLRAFCIIKTQELGYGLYEVIEGEFILDTIINASFETLGIANMVAIGKNRFITTVTLGAGPKTFSLISVDDTGTEILFEAEVATDKERYYIQTSKDPSVFYWVGREIGGTKLYKASVAGDPAFKRNVEPVEDLTNQEGKNGAGNVDNNQEDDSDEGIGSLPLSITLLLLMFLIPRSTRRTK